MPTKNGKPNLIPKPIFHLISQGFHTFNTDDRHTTEIAAMALDLLAGSVVFQIPHKPNSRLQMRMGIHSGPAVGVVAGSKIPKYL